MICNAMWLLQLLSPLKHPGLVAFSITKGDSLSPATMAKNAMVRRSFDVFPPLQSFLFLANVF